MTYVGPREQLIASRARSGYLGSLSPRERLRLPAKLFAALTHAAYLLQIEEAQRL